MKNIFYIVLIIFLSSCSSDNYKLNIESEIKSELLSLNLLSNVNVESFQSNSIQISIVYKLRDNQKVENSFFLDKKSNTIINSILIEKLFEKLKDFNTIKINLGFESLDYIYSTTYTKKEIKNFHNYFLNEVDIDILIHTVKIVKYFGIVKLNKVINNFTTDTDFFLFEFEGDFWDLIINYEKCNNIKTEILLITVVSYVSEYLPKLNLSCTKEDFYYYLKYCNLDKKLLKLNIYDLEKVLSNGLKVANNPWKNEKS